TVVKCSTGLHQVGAICRHRRHTIRGSYRIRAWQWCVCGPCKWQIATAIRKRGSFVPVCLICPVKPRPKCAYAVGKYGGKGAIEDKATNLVGLSLGQTHHF